MSSTILLPQRAQPCIRYCSNKHNSSSPHAHSFALGCDRYCSNKQPQFDLHSAVINTHIRSQAAASGPSVTVTLRVCDRVSAPPWVGSRSPDGWDQIPRWAGGWVLHQPPWSFGFDSQTSLGTRENRAPPCVKVPGSSRVPAPATLEFWVRFSNERNQGKQGATLC
jgi:hypothetical protein